MQRNQRKKGAGKRTKTSRGSRPVRLQEGRSAARVPNIATADELDVNLEFVYSSTMNNSLGGATTKEFTPNAAYDVDPSLGSTSTNAFDAYALLYSYYRVHSYRYRIEVANTEAFPVAVYLYNTNTVVSGSAYDVFSGNPYCSRAMLATSIGRHMFSGSITCSKLLGSIEAETDATTRALTTGVPTDLLFLTLAATATGGAATLTTGVSYMVSITMRTRFYGRIYNAYLSSPSPVPTKEHYQQRIAEMEKARAEYELKKKVLLIKGAKTSPTAY